MDTCNTPIAKNIECSATGTLGTVTAKTAKHTCCVISSHTHTYTRNATVKKLDFDPYNPRNPIFKSLSVYRNTKIIIYKTLIRPVITYGAGAWTMSSETGKRLDVFERKVLRKMVGAIKFNNCWRRRHDNVKQSLYTP
jgi:hypothetical protein